MAKHLRTAGRPWYGRESLNDGRLDLFYLLLAGLAGADVACLAAAARRASRWLSAVSADPPPPD